jgi:hypothetical protein
MTKTLKLTLKAQPFELMQTYEKCNEFRKPSDWIKSRLYNKDGSMKNYDLVEFTNGYGSTRPRFTAYYCGFSICQKDITLTYSNGLVVKVEKGDFIISFYKDCSEINSSFLLKNTPVKVRERRKKEIELFNQTVSK